MAPRSFPPDFVPWPLAPLRPALHWGLGPPSHSELTQPGQRPGVGDQQPHRYFNSRSHSGGKLRELNSSPLDSTVT